MKKIKIILTVIFFTIVLIQVDSFAVEKSIDVQEVTSEKKTEFDSDIRKH